MLDPQSEAARILVVEDEEQLRTLFAYRLKAIGYNVTSCGEVKEAKKLLESEKYDLVILDLRLGDGTGEEIIRLMRESEPEIVNRTTPILVISGHIDTDLLETMKHQVNASLAKPFDAKQLIEKVKKVCRL